MMTINLHHSVVSVVVLTLLSFGSAGSFSSAADQDDADQNDAEKDPKPQRRAVEFFESKIRPVLVKHCYECHSEEADDVSGGLLLDSREGIRRGGETAAAVVPGKLGESLLISSLEYRDFEMPPSGKLPDDVIRNFRKWVADGAVDPRTQQHDSGAEPEPDEPAASELWSLQPITNPTPPDAGDWARSGIDRFIRRKLDEHHLEPVADAKLETLLRRLSMDLTGLLPSPEQQKAFSQAAESHFRAALESVVDEQLASPQFGERWARHWMDAVRYAESAGNSRDVLMPWAWRYRDYLIDAFNADIPYDRFITEQIAGDLLEADSWEERDRLRIATGLLATGSKSLNGGNIELDMVDDQIGVIGKAILGLTVSCARCHDHKFDPIPTADYYALAGIFRSTKTLYGGGIRRPKNATDKLKVYLPLGENVQQRVKKARDVSKEIASLSKKKNAVSKQVARLNKQLPKKWLAKKKELIARRDAQDAQKSGQDSDNAAKPLNDREKKLLEKIDTFEKAQEELSAIQKQLKSLRTEQMPELDFAVGVRDAGKIADSPIHIRGEKGNRGEVVPRGFLSAVSVGKPVTVGDEQSGRLALAQWLTQPDHPLTSRVIVNRVWQHLFGRGLVETVDNFGVNGTRPSHPELLDWLARRLVHKHHWSMKSLIREIVLSRTYGLSSEFDEQNYQSDPGNVFLWRASRRRLEAEPLRDAILAASGQLDLKRPHGSAVMKIGEGEVGRGINTKYLREPFPHRAVYLPIIRTKMNPFLKTFDHPEPSNPQGVRDATNVPAQSLFFMNSPFVLKQAEALAERVLAAESERAARLEQLWRLTIGRAPTGTEINRSREFLASTAKRLEDEYPKPDDRKKAVWAMLGQAMFASAEFRYLD